MTTQVSPAIARLVEDYRAANTKAQRAERLDCPLARNTAIADRSEATRLISGAGYDHLAAALRSEATALRTLHQAIELGDQARLDQALTRATRVRASIARIIARIPAPAGGEITRNPEGRDRWGTRFPV